MKNSTLMKTTVKRKSSVLLLVVAAIAGLCSYFFHPHNFQPEQENDFIKGLKKQLGSWTEKYGPEKIYLQADKSLYEPGETVWLSTYVCDGSTLKPSGRSDIAYVELVGPRGSVEKKLSLVCRQGKAAADFQLAEDAPGGIYKIRAYTNWMKNEGDSACFEKTIQVQDVVLPALKMKLDFERKAYAAGDMVTAKLVLETNENKALADLNLKYSVQLKGAQISSGQCITDKTGEVYVRFRLPEDLKSNDGLLNMMIPYNGSTESISRAVPIVLNRVKLELFPEGGDLVSGLTNHVAFRAVDEFSKPADVEGVLLDESGRRITAFSSFHQGMGSFVFTPEAGKKYFVKVLKPAAGDTLMLPEAWTAGMVMHTEVPSAGQLVVHVGSSGAGLASLVMQMHGKIIYSTLVNLLAGNNSFTVSTEGFPAGVAQVTLFDHRNVERAERLCFLNRDRQLQISMTPDKQKYQPGEKVKLSLMVKDETGLPASARLSLAVVNDQLLSFADDRSGNILSQLLLESELRQKVEEPTFYFDRSEKKSLLALDHLLMTAGWRRFTWERIQSGEVPVLKYLPEKAGIGGTVLDANSGGPVAKAKIKLQGQQVCFTDEKGHFNIPFVDLSEVKNISIEASGFFTGQQQLQNYNPDMIFYLYNQKYYHQQVRNQKSVAMSSAVFENLAVEDFKAVPQAAGGAKLKSGEARVKKDLNRPAAGARAKALFQPAKFPAFQHDLAAMDRDDMVPVFFEEQEQSAPLYYRARKFAVPAAKTKASDERTDFRSTIFWMPDLEVNHTGRQSVEFVTSEEITSFRAIAEGIGGNGLVGHSEQVFYNQLPFAISAKLPVEMVCGDKMILPVTLKNNTAKPIGGVLSCSTGTALVSSTAGTLVQTLMPGESKTVLMEFLAKGLCNQEECLVSFSSCGFNDAAKSSVRIVPRGFPVEHSFSGQDLTREFELDIRHVVNGSLRADFSAFPNVVTDLLKGVEGILQEPTGCFEQTSCTAYPNAMVLDYLNHTGSSDTKVLAQAENLLNRGYKRLTTFETPGRGYEWFGANPAHEGLTAYGIMEFVDMQRAGQKIDREMLDRTVQWLLNHRDGKGGFAREQRALHDFGRISDDVLNGYIVYALAEAGYTGFDREYEMARQTALRSGDAYLLAMHANAAFASGRKADGEAALGRLIKMQQADGSLRGSTHSITYSQGISLNIETTSLALMAAMSSPDHDQQVIRKAVAYLVSSRSASGTFSSTQGTILALKALTRFAKFSRKTASAGDIRIYVDGKKVAERKYDAGQQEEITLSGLDKYLTEGKHKIRVVFDDTREALPYTVAVRYNTSLPASQAECAVGISCKLSANKVQRGETARISVEITNRKKESLPSTMALVGIPAGLSLQPWQLKDLQEKGLFDYYELRGNQLALYYRGMAGSDRRVINFDLKADIPGSFEAPATCAYLYYTNELKSWTDPLKIEIR